jgi:biotin transport system substrate-specific component
MNKNKIATRDICLIALFTAVTAVMAQITIPMPMGVPMTMQTFAISLAGVALGARRGFICALIYVLLGFVGAPVFAGFHGGYNSVFGPTGGFIMSFPVMAWTAGLGAERGGWAGMSLGHASGMVINFACGMMMFSAITGNGLWTSFAACVLPFVPTGIIKAALAAAIGLKIRERRILPA